MRIVGPINTGLTTGGAGVSTNNADTTQSICGLVAAVYIKYNGAPPAGTTDVTIATKGTSAPAYNVLKISNAATDGLFLPRKATVDQAGAALLYAAGGVGVADLIPVNDIVNVLIEGADDNDSADVWLYLKD